MAYPAARKRDVVSLKTVPFSASLSDGTPVVLDRAGEEDVEPIHALLNSEIERGDTYPFDTALNRDEFLGYYMAHDCFVLKTVESREFVGSFYVKPNFPGRCSHVCNGGFLVAGKFRGKQAGKIMGMQYVNIAAELGYRMSMFNLVFVTNVASVRLWDSLGFKRNATVPKVANLKGIGYTDAYQYILDLTTVPTYQDRGGPPQQQ